MIFLCNNPLFIFICRLIILKHFFYVYVKNNEGLLYFKDQNEKELFLYKINYNIKAYADVAKNEKWDQSLSLSLCKYATFCLFKNIFVAINISVYCSLSANMQSSDKIFSFFDLGTKFLTKLFFFVTLLELTMINILFHNNHVERKFSVVHFKNVFVSLLPCMGYKSNGILFQNINIFKEKMFVRF